MPRGTRAYLRLDPGFDERKESYPDGPYAAFIAALCLAESQPDRGRFRSERFLRALLGRRGRHLKYLLAHGDLIRLSDGRLYLDGWDEWQEGDVTVQERLTRLRARREAHGLRRNGSGPRATLDTVAGATDGATDHRYSGAVPGGSGAVAVPHKVNDSLRTMGDLAPVVDLGGRPS